MEKKENNEVIEIDVEQFLKAVQNRVYSVVFFVLSMIDIVVYVYALLSENIVLEIGNHVFFIVTIMVFFIISILLSMTKWCPKNMQDANVVVELPKSVLDSFKSAVGVSGLVASTEYEKLDIDGDGEILVSELYTKSEEEVEKEIKNLDSDFSIESFKNYAKTVFAIVQNAWSNNSYEMLRPFQCDSLYYRQKLKIEDMIKSNLVNRRTKIRVKGILLKDFRIEGDYEILVVMMTANMKMTYPETAYSTVDGDFPYILKFMRKKGAKTKSDGNLETTNCSNCGAVIDVDGKGICKYCGTSLVSGEHVWVLSDIRNVKLSGM